MTNPASATYCIAEADQHYTKSCNKIQPRAKEFQDDLKIYEKCDYSQVFRDELKESNIKRHTKDIHLYLSADLPRGSAHLRIHSIGDDNLGHSIDYFLPI
eukprot:IDg21329t1